MKPTRDKLRKQLVKRTLNKTYPKLSAGGVEAPRNFQALAHCYACEVLKKRWYIAEPFIQEDRYWWFTYCNYFNIIDE